MAGKEFDNDVAVKAMLQIKDIMMKSEKLKTSAKNNTEKDFEFAYFDNIDDALIEGLEQNQDFFSLLLSNDEMKRKVLGIFSDEIYNSLKKAEQKSLDFLKQKNGEITIRFSAAQYLTYVATVGDQRDSIEMRYNIRMRIYG